MRDRGRLAERAARQQAEREQVEMRAAVAPDHPAFEVDGKPQATWVGPRQALAQEVADHRIMRARRA